MNQELTNQNESVDNMLMLIQALCHKDAYPHAIEPVRIIETHISRVLLTGKYAYKIKKPVNFGFLDFSSLAKRRFYCQEELRLNARLSKELYLEVVAITGTFAHPKISGSGDAIEYAVKMQQFPSGQLLSEFAEQGALTVEIMDQLALQIADFHTQAAHAGADSSFGTCDNIKHWFDENFQHIQPLLDNPMALQQLQAIQDWGELEWRKQAHCMELRRLQGFVREGHGDLHLSNITMIQGAVVPFDCIEFNAMLRWIDVQSEVAFLFIDLCYFGYAHFAVRLLNRYLQQTGDYAGLQMLRYYLVYRALVLAKVALLKRSQSASEALVARRYDDYQRFAQLAENFTKTKPVFLMITHGFSGAGKSYFAGQLSEQLGAVWLRSDIERKRLFGYSSLADTDSGINDGVYTQTRSLETYQALQELAREIMLAGFSVVVDATFLKYTQRDDFRRLAMALSATFLIVDFQASDSALCERIRQRQNDASEANTAVLRQQQQFAEPLSEMEWQYAIALDTEQEGALAALLTAIDAYGVHHV